MQTFAFKYLQENLLILLSFYAHTPLRKDFFFTG